MTLGRALAALAVGLLIAGACSDDDEDRADPGPPASEDYDLVTTDVPGRPSAVAATDHALWVADDMQGVVHHLDIDTGAALGPPVDVDAAPIAVDAHTGVVWVADASGVVTRIDAAAAATFGPPITLGGALVDIVVWDATAWVGDIEAGVVHPIDAATGTVRAPIPVPGGVVRLALVGDQLWVTGLERSATPIDVATGAVGAPVEVGEAPIGVTAAVDGVWVANSDDDTVVRLTSDGQPTFVGVGDAPVAITSIGTELAVASQDDESLTLLDLVNGFDARVVPLGMRPRDIVAVPGGVWVVGVEPSLAVFVRAG